MSDEEEKKSLTDRTLERLRALAEGNGLAPEALELVDRNENLYTLAGTLRLRPTCDVKTRRYPGPPSPEGGRDAASNLMLMPSLAALQEEIARQRQSFMESGDWVSEALQELENAPGHGWGHAGARLALGNRTTVFATAEPCPSCRGHRLLMCSQCQGQQQVVCAQCQGQGREYCPTCSGRGEDPQNPQQPCPQCHGARLVSCRFCHATGRLACPSCGGRGGTPCSACRGTGQMTEEATLEGQMEVDFQLSPSANLPSGLLRAVSRVGLPNMAKNIATIELLKPETSNAETLRKGLQLKAHVPYADIKLRLWGKTILIGAFGHRGMLFNVPAFLDTSLKPWREHLRRAVTNPDALLKALEARALRDALVLALRGQKNPDALRRLYPVGLSANAAREILQDMHLVIRRSTQKARTFVAVGCLLANTLLFAGAFWVPAGLAAAARGQPLPVILLLALAPLVLGLAGSWAAFHQAIRLILQRRFPGATLGRAQGIGKIGRATLAGVGGLYLVLFLLSPWGTGLIHLLQR